MALPIGTAPPDSSPLVIAHRGASAEAPENTIASFELALEQGADALAFEVHLSRDEQLVVIDPFTVERTTDGAGTVADHTVRELKRLDAGTWYAPRFRGQRVQTLQEVLERFRDRTRFLIEIRGGIEVYPNIDDRLVSTLEIYEATDRALIQSLDVSTLARIRSFNPVISRAVRVIDEPLDAVITAPGPITALCVRWDLLTAGRVGRVRQAGLACHAWTVTDLASVPDLVTWGVSGIITDRPGLVRTGLGR